MNQKDLYIEYARVIEMCQGTALEDTPWACVKSEGNSTQTLTDDGTKQFLSGGS